MPGFNGQHNRNNVSLDYNDMARYEGRNVAPTSHAGVNLAHNYYGREVEPRNYNRGSNGRGFVQNGVYHRNENVNAQDRGVVEPRRSLSGETSAPQGNSGSAPSAVKQVSQITDVTGQISPTVNENIF